MYIKKIVALLIINILCVGCLSLSQEYCAKAQALATQPNMVANKRTVQYKTETKENSQRKIVCQILSPDFVIDVSKEDIEALCKIVEAEAGGEDKKGKLLVANVIINRVKNKNFPDTAEQVIYQKNSYVTQFTPVANGKIETVDVTKESIEAVYRALRGEDVSGGALYFMARNLANPSSVCWFDDNLTLLFSYGGHDFYI